MVNRLMQGKAKTMQGLIPRSFIDELLHQIDIVEFIDGYIPLKKRGTSHVACCPFHHEKNPSFNVVAKKQFYHCFGCGASGNAISFAMQYLQQSFPDAIETLAARAGIQVPREQPSKMSVQKTSLYQIMQQITQFYQQTLKNSGQVAIDYLKKRGITGHIAQKYQLGYAPNGWHTLESPFKSFQNELLTTGMLIQRDDGQIYDRYRHRIMYPIHDRNGHIIGFGGRSLDDSQKPKYLNSPETVLFQKNRELYGLHQCLQQKNDISSIIVVEGYMDVIALAQHGVDNAVATLGTATSTYHIQLLSKYTKQVIFCFDGDEAGRQAAWRALESSLGHLDGGLNTQFVFLPQEHDPDSLIRLEGQAAFLKRLNEALPLHRFFIDTLLKDIDTHTLSGKTQLISKTKPYLSKMPEGPAKELLIEELVRITHIEPHRILQYLTEKSTQAIANHPQQAKSITRTPIHVAMALLLQQPEIYSPDMIILTLADSHQALLQQIIQAIQENPSLTTGSLIELWRDTPWFETINALAAWDHQVPQHAQLNELKEIFLFINKQTHENKIKILIEKARNMSLTETERRALQSLLQERHHTQ